MQLRKCLFLAFFLITQSWAVQKIIYLVPGEFGNAFDTNILIGNAQYSCVQLKKYLDLQGYSFKQCGKKEIGHLNDASAIIFFDSNTGNLSELSRYPYDSKILFLWEPPVNGRNFEKTNHDQFSRIMTWDDTLVDNKTYFKFHYPQPTLSMVNVIPYAQKKLCTVIACNKKASRSTELYGERKKAIEFFEKIAPNDFDLYGVGWDKSGYKTYRGTVKNKIETLQKYKFCICYENTRGLKGYVTEKIFDCFVAGCVPVYWGADNIEDYVPKSCFIDRRDFDSLEELYQFMNGMTQQKYDEYINNIALYLASEQTQKFSAEYFVKTVCTVLGIQ